MEYTVVELEQKNVVGISATTSNTDADMGAKIGGLWTDFYQKGIYESIKNKKNAYAIGLYCDYTHAGYQVVTGVEVSSNGNPELVSKVIPGGKYAKFSVKGHMVTAVVQAWNEIWEMELNRSFTADFEEYLNADMENAEVNIYVSLKED